MKVERLLAPTGGMNTSASPDYIPANQAQRLDNLLVGQGKLYLRGPITSKIALGGSADANPAVWTHGDNTLMLADSQHYTIDAAAGTATEVTPAKALESSRHARVGSVVFGAIEPTDGSDRDLGYWNPATGITTIMDDGPVDFTDVREHLTRLFVLGGSVPGTDTPVEDLKLYWSDRGGPGVGSLETLDDWKDDDSGLVNQITYAQTDSPVALAHVGRWLAILMRRSIYLLTGDTPASFAIRLAARGVGCIDRESVVETAGGCFFLSDSGYMFFDGSAVICVSDDINLGSRGLMHNRRSYNYRAEALSDRHILVSKCGTSTLVGSTYLYNIEAKAWTTITTSLSPAISILMPIALSTYALAFDGIDIYDISTLLYPQNAVTPGDDTDADGTEKTIPVKFYSRPARLASPTHTARARRLLIDYLFTADPDSVADVAGTVELYQPAGTRVLTANSLAAISTAAVQGRQRDQQLVPVEADSIEIHISLQTYSSELIPNFELYDMWIEYDEAQTRGTI